MTPRRIQRRRTAGWRMRDGAWWEMTSGPLRGHYPAAALVGPLAGNVTLLWTPDGDQ